MADTLDRSTRPTGVSLMTHRLGSRPSVSLLAAALAALGPAGLRAQTNVHNTGAAGNWTTTTTWQGGVVPNNGTPLGATYNAFLDNANGGTAYTVTLDSGITVNALTIST